MSLSSSVSSLSIKNQHGGGEADGRSAMGLSYLMAGFFILAQLAGAGFLSLPSAVANTGWIGIPMLILLCGMTGLAATKLGDSWIFLERRWPEEYSVPARSPYMEMAYRSYGVIGRRITLFCVVVSQYGGTTMFIILISETMSQLTKELSTCYYVLITGIFIIPLTWLGTPKDFWQGPALAVVSTVFAIVIIFIQTCLDSTDTHYLQYRNPTVTSFALGFGAITYAFGGASVFPTIQNDMKDRSKFWKSILIGFLIIISLYTPIAAAGYAVYGYGVDSNVLFSVTETTAVKVAMGLQVVNLLGSYLIGFNTVSQAMEDVFNIPSHFTWKRVVCRTCIVLTEMLIGLAIPDFSLILNLMGGSTVTMCTFILPPLMYLKLAGTGPVETREHVPQWMKIALIEIMIIGAIGGVLSTVSAFYAIITTPLSQSCLSSFDQH